MKVRRSIISLFSLSFLMALASGLMSCVHEWPEQDNDKVKVCLKVRHDLTWTEYEYALDAAARSGSSDWKAQYVFHVYRAGDFSAPVSREVLLSDDLSLADFDMALELPSGEWDIYVWQDLVSDGRTPYYDTSDFSHITYLKPYRGDTDRRDAFEGHVSVSVPSTVEAGASLASDITLERPTAKYVFIATDFDEFCAETLRKEQAAGTLGAPAKAPTLEDFSVIARYPLFMPGVYDMFDARVSDSFTGISYDASIRPIDDDEAVIASDYVFMNHHNSGVQVQLSLKSPSGDIAPLTATVTVPLLRGQITYVRGKFLTASVGSGLDIDFSFSDDINIKI